MTGMQLFPFPTAKNGARQDGSLYGWPPVCVRCTSRPCEAAKPRGPQLCSYGVNFAWATPDVLVAGLIISDWNATSPARSKRLREKINTGVSSEQFDRALRTVSDLGGEEQAELDRRRRLAESEVIDSTVFQGKYLSALKGDILKGLSFVHDYKQINAQITQNINVIIEEKYVAGSFEEKLGLANRQEKAIYYGSKFLEEKLNVAKFLLNPEWLELPDECNKSRVHGAILKYTRLYLAFFEAKRVRLFVKGESRREVVANSSAMGVIPHTLIDNALKYAPQDTRCEIFITDDEDREGVYLEVCSFGPQLDAGEDVRIFHPFYRGRLAAQSVEEGAGYGLYVAQLVAQRHLGTIITVKQDLTDRHPQSGAVWTVFAIQIPPVAKAC